MLTSYLYYKFLDLNNSSCPNRVGVQQLRMELMFVCFSKLVHDEKEQLTTNDRNPVKMLQHKDVCQSREKKKEYHLAKYIHSKDESLV